MALGLFDVLGPVMHGPSSNHTGGAGRIGYLARLIMGGQPDRVVLGFHPDYMKSYSAQHSHIGLIAGCLGIREYDVDFPISLEKAADAGMAWEASPVESDQVSRNTMRVTGYFPGGACWSVNGDSVGGGSIVVDAVNGIPVYLTGNEKVLLLFTEGGEADARSELAAEAGDQSEAAAEATARSELAAQTEAAVRSALVSRGLLTGSVFSGCGSDGRHCLFFCVKNLEQAEQALQDLPEPIREALGKGRLKTRLVPPIYRFEDTGEEPLVSDFAGLLELLGRGEDYAEIAVRYEMQRSGVTAEEVLEQGRFLVSVIRDSLKRGESSSMEFIGGFADPGDGKKLYRFAESEKWSVSPGFTKALARAVTLAGMNASGTNRIVACPTGGSAGTLPAVLLTAAERYGADDETLAKAFLAAGLTGVLIGAKASFSGTVGGCQSEVGIGAAMGAAGVAWMAGATGEEAVQAAVIALKNVLGLSCDPPVPATEVPCIKRNAMGVAVAFVGADLGMAGVRSAVAPDDVVDALADSQRRLPVEIKFGGRGGLAGTASGKAMMETWKSRLE